MHVKHIIPLCLLYMYTIYKETSYEHDHEPYIKVMKQWSTPVTPLFDMYVNNNNNIDGPDMSLPNFIGIPLAICAIVFLLCFGCFPMLCYVSYYTQHKTIYLHMILLISYTCLFGCYMYIMYVKLPKVIDSLQMKLYYSCKKNTHREIQEKTTKKNQT